MELDSPIDICKGYSEKTKGHLPHTEESKQKQRFTNS